MVSKPNTIVDASMPAPAANHLRSQTVELSLGKYNVNGASIDCGREGTTFAFTLWPISDATLTALEREARNDQRICLVCCDRQLLLDLLAIERKGRQRVRIVGRVVGSTSDVTWGSAQETRL
jgi:hypothetical protein